MIYTLLDRDGRVLWIGATDDLIGQLDRHARRDPWFADVVSATVEHTGATA